MNVDTEVFHTILSYSVFILGAGLFIRCIWEFIGLKRGFYGKPPRFYRDPNTQEIRKIY